MTEIITLDQNSPEVQYLCKRDKRLAKVISMVGPITYRKRDEYDAYSFIIHEIIEQMLSVKAAAKIYSRLEELCDGQVSPEMVNKLSDEEIKSIGTANSKVSFIRGITNSVISGQLNFAAIETLPDAEAMKYLTSFRGIGNWTAKMYLLFVLNRHDILPYEDTAFLQSYKWMYKTEDISPKAVMKRCSKWKPYTSIAARFLYYALDMGLVREEFHLFK